MKCNCFECPLGKKSYERYLKICDDLNEEPNFDEAVYDIWCDKTGYKCGWYGHCDEAFDKDIIIHKTNRKQSSKRTRSSKYKKRLKVLSEISNYPPPAMYIEEKWDKELRKYNPLDKPYYKRCYRANHNSSRYQFYKRYSNKKVRNYGFGIYEIDEDIDELYPYNKGDGQLKYGGSYKKVFDYWWTVD